jgi:membrane fusion protein (multidrug efflux system)
MSAYKINRISFVAIMLVLTSLFGCGSNEHTDKVETKVPIPKIEVVSPKPGRLVSNIRIPGELQAFQQVDLFAKVNSFVSRLTVDVGSEVHKGQLLAVLDAPELKARQSAATAQLHSQQALYLASKATYERLLETSKTPGTVSANDLEQAYGRHQSELAQYNAAKATQREISDMQEYLQIKAPFDGIITVRNVSPGAFVGTSGPGSQLPIFTLVERKKLRLVVSIPESNSVNLNKLGEVKFTINTLPNDTLTAKISRSSGALDNRMRSQRIEMDVQNNEYKLMPGMVAEIFIPLKSNKTALTIPSQAVLNSTLGTFVIRVKGKKVEWIPVTLGIAANNVIEVFGKLTAQDTIVKLASEEIRNGSVLN